MLRMKLASGGRMIRKRPARRRRAQSGMSILRLSKKDLAQLASVVTERN